MAKIDATSQVIETKSGKKRKHEVGGAVPKKKFAMSAIVPAAPATTKSKKRQSDTAENARGSKRSKDDPVEKSPSPKHISVSNKAKKRLTEKAESSKVTKRPKTELSDAENSTGESDDEVEPREPTNEELEASEKPENTPGIETIRQKKKLKHQQIIAAKKDQSTNKEVTKNEEYLLKWKNNKSEWKFEKLRQISIQSTVFDESKISNDTWPIALEYLSGSKGAAKEKITQIAQETLDKLGQEIEKTGDRSLISSSRYIRARELMQSFD